LKYGYRDNGSWETENVIGGGGGLFNSLIIDAEAASHTIYSYFTGTELVITHAVREDTSWETDTITKGIDCHALLGPEGKIHVSLAEENNTGLVYAVSSGSGWTTEKIAEAAGLPAYTHVCVNGRGDVFVSYFNFEEHDLRIVTKEEGTWTHEVVATGAYVGLPHSMALDNSGYPLIVYYDSDNGDLKLAHYDPLSDIELRSFKTERAPAGVDIRWRVGNAANVAGFNIYRAGRESEREKINRKLIKGASPFEYHDGTAAPSAAYEYWLEAVSMTGKTRVYGPTSAPPSAKAAAFMLHQNTPNPWRSTTTFAFELPEGAEITLAVYDISGRKVADVTKGYYGAGRHVVPFERALGPGVYVYRLEAGRETAARRTVVIK
jgi:hypothetical protein